MTIEGNRTLAVGAITRAVQYLYEDKDTESIREVLRNCKDMVHNLKP